MTPPTIYTIRGVIFSTHSVVRIYDTPNYLYDKGVSYFLLILWLEYMTPPTIYTIYAIGGVIFSTHSVVRIYDTPNYLYGGVIFSTHSVVRIYDTPNYLYPLTIYTIRVVSYFLLILWLEYMTPPTIYTIRGCHIFYSFCG